MNKPHKNDRAVDDSPEYLFLLPWLTKGGADLGALHTANTLTDKFQKSVAVVTTEAIPSPWSARLAEQITFFELGMKLSEAPNFDRAVIKALDSIISSLNPRIVHIMNSRHGWMWLRLLHEQGARSVYASLYCDEITRDGLIAGYPRWFLESTWQDLAQIVSDNNHYPQQWSDRYQIPYSKFCSVHFPILDLNEQKHLYRTEAAYDSKDRKLHVLWASRISKQKRPELLAEIAMLMPDANFHVYGDPDSEIMKTGIMNRLASIPNVFLKGSFNSILETVKEVPDCFLYTSEFDGTPNILLEISQLSIPIVAPRVGGIDEFFPVEWPWAVSKRNSGTPSAYVTLLKKLASKMSTAANDAEHLRCLVKTKHSHTSFQRDLQNIPGYINANVQSIGTEKTEFHGGTYDSASS